MPSKTYLCSECGFKEEYIESFSVAKENWHPEICPKCGIGKLESIFDMSGHSVGIDFVGSGFYINDHGKHNWRLGKTKDQIAKVLSNQSDPY